MSSTGGSTPLKHPEERFQPVAAVLAFLLPGAGHYYLGHRLRGVYIATGVLGLYLSGLLVAGLDAVDRRSNPVSFIGQALVGPVALGTNWVHQNHFKAYDPRQIDQLRSASQLPLLEKRSPNPSETRQIRNEPFPDGTTASVPVWSRTADADPPYEQSFGKVNELGMLFCIVAGMMNLICIIDASMHRRRDPKADPPETAKLDHAPRTNQPAPQGDA